VSRSPEGAWFEAGAEASLVFFLLFPALLETREAAGAVALTLRGAVAARVRAAGCPVGSMLVRVYEPSSAKTTRRIP
jgi:hypothetical protein